MHAVATALRAKGFLTYVGGIIYTSSMPFNIPAYVWKELVGHKHELLSQEDWDNPQLEGVFNNIDQGMKENERTTYR